MIDFTNDTDFELDIQKLEQIANDFSTKMIELILTNNETIQEINNEYRGKNSPTDVLSFPLEDMPMAPLGSIIISLDIAKDKAKELNHSIQEEITLLFIHGLLHLVGFDHEVDDGQMRAKEEELITKYNLPKSLIVRTEENI